MRHFAASLLSALSASAEHWRQFRCHFIYYAWCDIAFRLAFCHSLRGYFQRKRHWGAISRHYWHLRDYARCHLMPECFFIFAMLDIDAMPSIFWLCCWSRLLTPQPPPLFHAYAASLNFPCRLRTHFSCACTARHFISRRVILIRLTLFSDCCLRPLMMPPWKSADEVFFFLLILLLMPHLLLIYVTDYTPIAILSWAEPSLSLCWLFHFRLSIFHFIEALSLFLIISHFIASGLFLIYHVDADWYMEMSWHYAYRSVYR